MHIIAANYNWDNGFEIPYNIINNKNCDLGTALMIFYDADGYRVLENKEELKNPNITKVFIEETDGYVVEIPNI